MEGKVINRKIKTVGIALFLLMSINSDITYSQLIKSYGLKIGLTISNVSVQNIQPRTIGNNTYTLDYSFYEGKLISPSITGWINLVDDELLNLEIEASYLRKGSSETNEYEFTTFDDPFGPAKKEKYTVSIPLEYIQININPQIRYNIGDITTYGIIGPTISYLIGYENTILENDKRKDLVFGYNFGIGIGLRNNLKNVFIEVKYNGDFTEFYKSNAEMRNKVLLINLGYHI
jgi:hypothetical protein